MSKHIDLLTTRCLQITFAFMLFAAIDQFCHIPHPAWIIITGALIYAGFDPTTVLKRAYHRFIGTITGIAAVVIMAFLIHLDFRLGIFFLVFVTWAMSFTRLLPYHLFMIPATMFSDLVSEISNSSVFLLQFYFIDRAVNTVIVFAICICMEYVWFGKSNFTVLSYENLLKTINKDLKQFYELTCTKKVTRAELMKKIRINNQQIATLQGLIVDKKYLPNNPDFYRYAGTLAVQTLHHFRKIVCLVYLTQNDSNNPKIETIKLEIEEFLNKE